jgi:hypothetical protein
MIRVPVFLVLPAWHNMESTILEAQERRIHYKQWLSQVFRA